MLPTRVRQAQQAGYKDYSIREGAQGLHKDNF